MSAASDTAVQTTLYTAKARRIDLNRAVEAERAATVAFMDEAVNAQMSWETIGERLGVSGTAARRYYVRNRRKVRSV